MNSDDSSMPYSPGQGAAQVVRALTAVDTGREVRRKVSPHQRNGLSKVLRDEEEFVMAQEQY